MTVLIEDGIRRRKPAASILSRPKFVDLGVQLVDLVLECGDMITHLLEFGRVFERTGAAVWRIDAFEVQVATAMAWLLAIAADLASLAFIAGD
jgi:hypothetical protein